MGQNQTTKKWERIPTYGGKLTENLVQAIARDCLAEAIQRLVENNYKVLFHIHDEVIAEVPKNDNSFSLENAIKIMCEVPEWAEGLPLNADGFTNDYFYHTFTITVNQPVDSVYAECYLLYSGMETWINKVNIFSGTSMLSGFITPVVYAADEWHLLYGSMHGGWGQFQYLHDTCSLMDTAKLNYLQSHYGTMDSTYLQQILASYLFLLFLNYLMDINY